MNLTRIAANAILMMACLVLQACYDQVHAASDVDGEVNALGPSFTSGAVAVNGTTLHYVRGGVGPPVVLLHGFPENWHTFSAIMPRLAKRFTVIAVDLRGVGGSAPATDGYDAANLALDVEQLITKLQLEHAYLVGHDIGGLVAYAFARRFPTETRGLMILDAPVPGTATWAKTKALPFAWHFGFLQTPGLAEKLLPGREAIFFQNGFFNRALLNRSAVTEADVARYADAYAAPEHLQAGIAFYRAFDADEAFNASHKDPIAVPLILAGGDKSFGRFLPELAQDLRSLGWSTIKTEIIEGSGHFVADEQPDRVAELIEQSASARSQ